MYNKLIEIYRNPIPHLCVLFSFLLPISSYFAIIAFDILCIVWLINFKKWRIEFKISTHSIVYIVLALFWLLHLLSLFYSKDITRGLSDVLEKISFLLFPLIFLTFWDRENLDTNKILEAFIYGLLATTLLSLFNALFNSVGYTFSGVTFNIHPIDTPWENYFLHKRLAINFHPTYLSMYYCFGIALLFYRLKREQNSMKSTIIQLLVLTLFTLMVVMLSSRANYISVVFVICFGVLWLFLRKSSLLFNISLIGVFILFFMILILTNSRFTLLLKGIGVKSLNSIVEDKELEAKIVNDNMIRLNIWKSIPTSMRGNWIFGYGVGDTKEVLVDGYKEMDIPYAFNNKFNAHNQFLETIVGLGLIGFVVLVSIFWVAIKQSLYNRNILYLMFLLIVTLNFIFESMLERIAGVLFFAFYISVLSLLRKK